MDKEVICLVDMFAMSADVIYPDGKRESVPLNNVLNYLHNVCDTIGVYNLHLMGNSEYLYGLLEDVQPTEYSNRKVNIKVN